MDESLSESNNNDNSITYCCRENNTTSYFEFDDSYFGLQINISKSARKYQIEIFTQLWADEIFDKPIELINRYGEKCR